MEAISISQLRAELTTLLGNRAEPIEDLRLLVRPLKGGLVSDSVLRISARYVISGARRFTDVVAKELTGEALREAKIYRALARSPLRSLAPNLLGVAERGQTRRLYLEAITPVARWPWQNASVVVPVLRFLARVHESDSNTKLRRAVSAWDYDHLLRRQAMGTLELAEQLRGCQALPELGRSLPALRRLVRGLSTLRSTVLSSAGPVSAVIHGDVHPGNVIVRKSAGSETPVLLDWARARQGSPLEDVSSWLQWLGFWEPEAKRRHDSFFSAYLHARGLCTPASIELRQLYWLCSASNCLSGALLYHLWRASDGTLASRQRRIAVRSARDCLRVLRRADAWLH